MTQHRQRNSIARGCWSDPDAARASRLAGPAGGARPTTCLPAGDGGWIVERLAMGTRGHLNHLLYRQRKAGID
jgi:hypothetical protein